MSFDEVIQKYILITRIEDGNEIVVGYAKNAKIVPNGLIADEIHSFLIPSHLKLNK